MCQTEFLILYRQQHKCSTFNQNAKANRMGILICPHVSFARPTSGNFVGIFPGSCEVKRAFVLILRREDIKLGK